MLKRFNDERERSWAILHLLRHSDNAAFSSQGKQSLELGSATKRLSFWQKQRQNDLHFLTTKYRVLVLVTQWH